VFDLAQLQLLSAIARTGSYTAAARELELSQPAVTYQMRRLERSIGTPVTVRVGRAMQLTPTGKTLLDHADRILAEVRSAERQVTESVGRGIGTVRLAAFPSSCATIVPSALAELRRSHPGLTVRVVQGEPGGMHMMVLRGDVDIALTYRFGPAKQTDPGPRVTSRLHRLPLVTEQMRLLLAAEHPAAAHSRVQVSELLDETWILASRRFEDLLNGLCAPHGRMPTVMMVADDYVAMQSFVAYGLGVAIVPDLALRVHRAERVIPRTLAGWPSRHLELELWPDQRRIPAVMAVVDALRAAIPRQGAAQR
jgi:molybdate transport repressor ModE-like protein